MVTDHTQTSKDLKGLVDSGDVKATIPVELEVQPAKEARQLSDTKPE